MTYPPVSPTQPPPPRRQPFVQIHNAPLHPLPPRDARAPCAAHHRPPPAHPYTPHTAPSAPYPPHTPPHPPPPPTPPPTRTPTPCLPPGTLPTPAPHTCRRGVGPATAHRPQALPKCPPPPPHPRATNARRGPCTACGSHQTRHHPPAAPHPTRIPTPAHTSDTGPQTTAPARRPRPQLCLAQPPASPSFPGVSHPPFSSRFTGRRPAKQECGQPHRCTQFRPTPRARPPNTPRRLSNSARHRTTYRPPQT